MELDLDLFPPIFSQVKQVQSALRSYCIPGDAIPIPMDNLKRAIEHTYDVKIETRSIPLDTLQLRGLIEMYPGKSIIYIVDEMNSAWKRYVFAKEACHHLIKDEGFYTHDPISVIEDIVLDELGINGSDDHALDVKAEILTKFAAIELLFPIEFRDKCKTEVNNGERSTYEISTYFDIPEHVVQYSLADHYMKASKTIWAQVDIG